jgi:hypothetical protein
MKAEYVGDGRFIDKKLSHGVVCHSAPTMHNFVPGFTLSDGRLKIEFTEDEARQAISGLQERLREYEDGTIERRIRDSYGSGFRR